MKTTFILQLHDWVISKTEVTKKSETDIFIDIQYIPPNHTKDVQYFPNIRVFFLFKY